VAAAEALVLAGHPLSAGCGVRQGSVPPRAPSRRSAWSPRSPRG
jgi:hypothetical protein